MFGGNGIEGAQPSREACLPSGVKEQTHGSRVKVAAELKGRGTKGCPLAPRLTLYSARRVSLRRAIKRLWEQSESAGPCKGLLQSSAHLAPAQPIASEWAPCQS
ncbi:hypothetical protein AAFF_G00092040 [Aldrovandia affinis]|uniref:Uncharacterized protein n=1 Tax=Aldrovandia affinis TaxID=143900 RepID=A0AAD7T3C0_9TELE|nr:hypothetical protein AAFF_G00092040 [Aldrovandia affinis]